MIKDSFQGKQEWIAEIRRIAKKKIHEKCVASGKKLQESSPPMTSDDLEQLCRVLFRHDSAEGFADRCLLIFQWQLFGRITEISNLSYGDLTFYRTANLRCLRVHINRSKTSDEQHIFVFPHSNWMLCPLHALACMVSGGWDGSEKVFPHGSAKCEVHEQLA